MLLTLCGSTKFKEAFANWNKELTLKGHIVYSVAMWSHSEKIEPSPEQKELLDLVHLAKIDNSDGIIVLNVGGYIGYSTRREINWAKLKNKQIIYLEPTGNGEPTLDWFMNDYN